MQIKAARSRQPDLEALRRLINRPGISATTRRQIESEIRSIQAGERAEREAAYQIELYFGHSAHWATIHDLRLDLDGAVAQIDHVIINRLAEVWLCESKSFAEGVSINEYGEWSRLWRGRKEGMPSPVEQNRRHAHVLQRVFDEGLVPLPRRLGLTPMKPRIRSLVLVSDNAEIVRPRRKVDGLDEVIKAEKLRTQLYEAFDRNREWDLLRLIGKEGLEQFARSLAGLHRPAAYDWAGKFGLNETGPVSSTPRASGAIPDDREPRANWSVKYDGPCASCGRILAKGTPAVWDRRRRRMYCESCASAAG